MRSVEMSRVLRFRMAVVRVREVEARRSLILVDAVEVFSRL
jgi:hypothetical protein